MWDHRWFQQLRSPSLVCIGEEKRMCFYMKVWSSTVPFLVAHLVTGNHHIPGILSGCQSWSLLKHSKGQKKGSCEGSPTALWWSSLVSCPKQINSSNFIHGKANISLHIVRKETLLASSLPNFSGSSALTWKTLHRTYLPATATIGDTDSQGHSRLFIQEEQLWKAWFSLPVFSYKLPDTGFRKICQESKT